MSGRMSFTDGLRLCRTYIFISRAKMIEVGFFIMLTGLYAMLEPILIGKIAESIGQPETPLDSSALLVPYLALWATLGLLAAFSTVRLAFLTDVEAHNGKLRVLAQFVQGCLSESPEPDEVQSFALGSAAADGAFFMTLYLFRDQVVNALTILLILMTSWVLNWRMALPLNLLLVLFIAASVFAISRAISGQELAGEMLARLNLQGEDMVRNSMLLRSYLAVVNSVKRLQDMGSEMMTAQIPVLRWWAIVWTVARCAGILCVLTMACWGVYLKNKGNASTGEVVAFIGFASVCAQRAWSWMGYVTAVSAFVPSLEAAHVIRCRSDLAEHEAIAKPFPISPEIALVGVSAHYSNGSRPAVDNVNLKMQSGGLTALVGQSGSGKSTIASMLNGLLRPSVGDILISGESIQKFGLNTLRQSTSYVSQNASVLSRSLRDNIKVAKADAEDYEIVAALQRAELTGFLEHLSDGLDTMIGAGGRGLSGGEKQRVAMARAFLRNSPLLILDEPTSALDTTTEASLISSIRELASGRTTLLISHKLALVKDNDMVFVLDQGRIVESGSLAELTRRDGKFSSLMNSSSLI